MLPLATCAALAVLLQAPAALAWRQELQGSRDGGADRAHAEALDAGGNVLVAGTIDNGEDGVAFVVTKLAAASGAEIWRREFPGSSGVADGALAIAVDAAGDVVAAGELDLDFTVIKLSGADGSEIWRRQIDGSDSFETLEEARAVAVDGSGDVFATGFLGNAGSGRDLAVVKLSGASGAEIWRREIDGGDGASDRGNAIAVDAAGDALVAGRLASAAAQDDFVVLKFAAAGGGELWRLRIDGPDHADDEALSLKLSPAGDAVACGVVDNGSPQQEDFSIVKIAGSSGSVLWQRDLDGGLGAPLGGSITYETGHDAIFDSQGDVVATGTLEYVTRARDFVVVKLAGSDGSEIWRREIEGEMVAANDVGWTVAVDAGDDVFAGGSIENGPRPSFDFSVLKLDGTTGDEIWRQMIDGSDDLGPRLEQVQQLLVNAGGDVVASGFLDNARSYQDFAVLLFDGATGIVGSVRGTKIRVADYAGRPGKRLFSADLFDPAIWTPAPGSADDPTLAGAEIRLVNPLTHEEASFVLPAGPNWRGAGNPPGSAGYVYSDDGSNGPCAQIEARPHNRLKVSCNAKLGSIPFTLDEASQGSVALTLRFGSAPLQCATFGGKIRKDLGTTSPGPKGMFQAVQARSTLGAACP